MRIPKAKNIFKSIQYHDIDDYLYVLYYYGKAMTRSPQWKSRPRTDFILWDVDASTKELVDDFKIDNTIDPTLRRSILNIICDICDFFCE